MSQTAIVRAESGSTVRMRAGASTQTAVTANIPIGATVEVLERNNNWSKISYKDKQGYMMTKFLLFPSSDTITVSKNKIEEIRSNIRLALEKIEKLL